MLPASNRLRRSQDFSRTTKTGHRATSQHLVIYLLQEGSLPVAPQIGLIINKSVGGSVTRHRIARHLRHAVATHLSLIPEHTHIVIRVLKESDDFRGELQELLAKVLKRVNSQNVTSQKIDVTA